MTSLITRIFGYGFSALTITLFVAASPANAATLNVVGGQLIGASGVNVGGNLYDIEFINGRCTTLFDGCNSAADFTFSDAGSATVASQALLDQVFLDGVSGSFDSIPNLTNGCTSSFACNALTPFATDGTAVTLASARNNAGANVDVTTFASLSTSGSTTAVGTQVYVIWTPIPEPGTALLMGMGLLAMGVGKRRADGPSASAGSVRIR